VLTFFRRHHLVHIRLSLVAALTATLLVLHQLGMLVPRMLAAPSAGIVISQIYGGGGNSGAPLTHDFIELFNRGNVPVALTGWSLQYTSATGTGHFGASPTQITELPAVTLNPGQYFLVQQAGGANGNPLPAADFIDATPIAMAATGGKVALASTTTPLGCNGGSTPCPAAALATIIDLVGYGAADFFEGAAVAPTLSNTTAAFRNDSGCTETDDNSADFSSATPSPRTTNSPLHPCSGLPSLSVSDVSVMEGDSGTVTATFVVSLSSPAESGGVTFDISTQDGSATAAGGDYTANSLVGQMIPAGQQTYSFEVLAFGDTNIEINETFFVNVTNVSGAGVGDGQGAGTITNDDFAPPVFDVVISQVYGGGGNAGATLRNDFIELFNRSGVAIDITGWSVQYTSATGTGTWMVTPLMGSIAPGGYYLVQQAAGAGGTASLPAPDATGVIAMGAGSGKVALRTTTTAIVGGCAADTTIVDIVGYGGSTCFEGAGPTAPTANTTAALRKRGGCFDSNDNTADFSVAIPNPRSSAAPGRTCDFIAAAIHEIQGNGFETPFLGRDVSTSGIVTARKTNGFFLQSPEAGVDADSATSEGVFVFTAVLPAVEAGDAVSVKGTATEFFGLTQLESTLTGDVTVDASGQPLPAPIVLTSSILDPAGTPDQLERFEGMRMHADALVSVAPTNNFGETFTVLPGVVRPMREPGIEISLPVPSDPTSGLVDCCIPRFDQNPERIMVDSDGVAGAAATSVTSHVTLWNVTGPLDFSFGDYKVLPEVPPTTGANVSAVAVPFPMASEFTVAGFNIENFGSNPRQRRKAALAIRDVMRSPDIIGLIEILNLASLEALAAQVNDDAVAAGEPNPGYEARLIPASATATQNVGFLVRTLRVQIDGVTQERAGESFINPNTGATELLHDRPPLVLRATVDPSGPDPRPIAVVVNHLRSFIDIEPVAGEGVRVRAKRTAQAESLAGLLQELQAADATLPIVSVGDYNAYEFNDGYTDPIAVIKGTPTADDQVVVDQSPDLVDPDFVNLTDSLPAAARYTFVFEGNPQALDHVLVNTVAHAYVQRYAIARSNADFPALPPGLFSGDATRPERSSDHDMPVAYFAFPPRATTISVPSAGVTYDVNGQNVALTAQVAAKGKAVSEGAVTFTVTTSAGANVGATSAAVTEGSATASFALPATIEPQSLVITAAFTGGPTTLPGSGIGTLTVQYAVCMLYDAGRAVKSGGVYPIRIQLCDASGTNVSEPDVPVTALHVRRVLPLDTATEVSGAGEANPDDRFRFDSTLAGYVFNLLTSGLVPGVYTLSFTAGADPAAHVVEFRVR
jgi:predicted extracellular nuclease